MATDYANTVWFAGWRFQHLVNVGLHLRQCELSPVCTEDAHTFPFLAAVNLFDSEYVPPVVFAFLTKPIERQPTISPRVISENQPLKLYSAEVLKMDWL